MWEEVHVCQNVGSKRQKLSEKINTGWLKNLLMCFPSPEFGKQTLCSSSITASPYFPHKVNKNITIGADYSVSVRRTQLVGCPDSDLVTPHEENPEFNAAESEE